jgi:hypothetical protein
MGPDCRLEGIAPVARRDTTQESQMTGRRQIGEGRVDNQNIWNECLGAGDLKRAVRIVAALARGNDWLARRLAMLMAMARMAMSRVAIARSRSGLTFMRTTVVRSGVRMVSAAPEDQVQ